jgi:hypothetical protein
MLVEYISYTMMKLTKMLPKKRNFQPKTLIGNVSSGIKEKEQKSENKSC